MAFGMDIYKIIKYEGSNDMLVWKHPEEDFNTNTQLIVHESQEAVFFKDGQALDLFGAGTYTLQTDNIPLLRRLINIPTNGKTPFHCEVYYINKVDILDIYWGTIQPMPIQDPVYGIILPVRANGQFALRVSDSRKLLVKLVGTTSDMTKENVSDLFRGILLTKAKNIISEMMTTYGVSFLEIHNYLDNISEKLREAISPLYNEYGMEITNFFVNSVSVPEDDPGYRKIRAALASAKEKELLAKGTRAEMDILGYSYQEKRTFDMLDRAASNEGAGAGILGAGIGMGMGINVGNTIGGAVGQAMTNVNTNAPVQTRQQEEQEQIQNMPQNNENLVCPKCGKQLPSGAKFCFICGSEISTNQVCPKCGTKLIPGAKYCLECGQAL